MTSEIGCKLIAEKTVLGQINNVTFARKTDKCKNWIIFHWNCMRQNVTVYWRHCYIFFVVVIIKLAPDDIYNSVIQFIAIIFHNHRKYVKSIYIFVHSLFSRKKKHQQQYNAYQNVSSLSQWHILFKAYHFKLELQLRIYSLKNKEKKNSH